MVTATATLTPFVGPMNRDTILGYVDRLMASGIDKDEAVTQTVDAIIQADRSDDFVRAFGGTSIKGMLTAREGPRHPSRWNPPETGQSVPATQGSIAGFIDSDDGDGQKETDAHLRGAAPPSPDPIPQTFPAPGTGRVVDISLLSKPRKLTGALAGKWSVDGEDVPLGLLTPEQCFKLAEIETRRGKAHITNGTMFRRLGQSLDPDQVVADRWDNAGIMTQFELAEPKLP